MQVAALNHKVLDDSVKQQRIVELHTSHFHKVVAMLRRLVEQGYPDVTFGGLLFNLSPILRPNAGTSHQQSHK
jgi:hypothetical protein